MFDNPTEITVISTCMVYVVMQKNSITIVVLKNTTLNILIY